MSCFIILLPCICSAVPQSDSTLILATGDKTGVYYKIGKGIEEVSNKAGFNIKAVNSAGSIENLKMLAQGKVQLCIAQSDAVYYAYNGLKIFPEKESNISIISALYTEAIHILIRNPLRIKKIEDMKGKRISVGPHGSGSEANALAVIESAGLIQNEINILHMTFDEALKELKDGNLDVVFITSGIPSEAVNKLLQDGAAYFFELRSDILSRLIETYPFFIITSIPPGTYSHQAEEITTIGVTAVLMGSTDLNENLIYNLTKIIFTNTKTLSQYHPLGGTISISAALRGASIPLSPGAARFYEESGLLKKERYRKITNYLFFAILAALIVFALANYKRVLFFFRKKEVGRVVVVLISVWVIDSTLLFFAEHKINENYSDVLLAFWSGLVNLINFGSKEPFTTAGRTISTAMTILWIAGITWFTGQIAAFFVHKKLIGGKKMDKLKGHFVIANWNNKGDGIIQQLLSDDIEEKKDIVVIAESAKLVSLREKYKTVHYISASPTDEFALRKAKVETASSVIILAKDNSANIADPETILIVLCVKKICKANNLLKHVHIVAEIIDPQKVELAEFAGDEKSGGIEIISAKHYGQKLLAQAAVSPGLSKVYDDLLTFDEIGGEVYKSALPPYFEGKTFSDLLNYALNLRLKNINVIPIAISRQEKLFVNPVKKDLDELRKEDDFFAIAASQREMNKFRDFCKKL